MVTDFLAEFERRINRSSVERTVLHVGCGPNNPDALHEMFRAPGWHEIRLDIDPLVRPDIVGPIIDMSHVQTSSVDAVWSSHNLVHLYPHEVPLALAEFFRVIIPGGFILITLPDLQRVAELVAVDKLEQVAYMSPAGPVALDMIYGYRPFLASGNLYMAHHTGFTARTLGMALLRARFNKVKIDRADFSLWGLAQKGESRLSR